MRTLPSLIAAAFLALTLFAEALANESAPSWLIGYWHHTFEDGSTTDAIEFKRNWEYVDYSKDCTPTGTGQYVLKNGKIHVIRVRSSMKQLSSPFSPTTDHKSLIVVLGKTGKQISFWRSQACISNKG
jgi:hypothetical protein